MTHQPQEPVVVDLLAEDTEHDRVVKPPETVGDITLDKPGRPDPRRGHVPQRGVAAPTWPEPVGMLGKGRFVIRLQQQTHHLADQLVRPRR